MAEKILITIDGDFYHATDFPTGARLDYSLDGDPGIYRRGERLPVSVRRISVPESDRLQAQGIETKLV